MSQIMVYLTNKHLTHIPCINECRYWLEINASASLGSGHRTSLAYDFQIRIWRSAFTVGRHSWFYHSGISNPAHQPSFAALNRVGSSKFNSSKWRETEYSDHLKYSYQIAASWTISGISTGITCIGRFISSNADNTVFVTQVLLKVLRQLDQ